MIINPFKCENCNNDLQPEDILITTFTDGELYRTCRFCGDKIKVNAKKI
jgi:hypothetical protein